MTALRDCIHQSKHLRLRGIKHKGRRIRNRPTVHTWDHHSQHNLCSCDFITPNGPSRSDFKMATYDQLAKTAKAYLDAHNNRDLDTIRALSTPDCIHRGGPASVASPVRNTDEYITFNAEVFKLMHTYEARLTDMVIDEKQRKVAQYMHAKATADVGVYENEYIITLTLTDDGSKVQEQYEFVGSHEMLSWMQKLGDFKKEHWDQKESST